MVSIATAKAEPKFSISPHPTNLFPAIAIKPISVPNQPKYTAPFQRFFINRSYSILKNYIHLPHLKQIRYCGYH